MHLIYSIITILILTFCTGNLSLNRIIILTNIFFRYVAKAQKLRATSYPRTKAKLVEKEDIAGNLHTQVTVKHLDEAYNYLTKEKQTTFKTDVKDQKEERTGRGRDSIAGACAVSYVSCSVCFEDFPSGPVDKKNYSVMALCLRSCGHYFCLPCWSHHLAVQIHQGIQQIKCPVSISM